jgi:hypothetical protein
MKKINFSLKIGPDPGPDYWQDWRWMRRNRKDQIVYGGSLEKPYDAENKI